MRCGKVFDKLLAVAECLQSQAGQRALLRRIEEAGLVRLGPGTVSANRVPRYDAVRAEAPRIQTPGGALEILGGLLCLRQLVSIHLRVEREPIGQREIPYINGNLAALGKVDRMPPGPCRFRDENLRQPMSRLAKVVSPFGKQWHSQRVARHQRVAVGLDGEELARESRRQAEVGLCAGLCPQIQPRGLAPRRSEDRQRPAE